jgi:small nuclear ribonucleoprotein (snRNP)-like protein
MKKRIFAPLIALMLVFALSAAALADTIRLKDGSVIRGQIIGFKDQQFIVLVGAGSRGRRSQITIYMEDVESIEFDSAANTPAINDDNNTAQTSRPITPTTTTTRPPIRQQPDISQNTRPEPDTSTSQPINQPTPSQTSGNFFQINAHVRGDNAANGWTNTGLVVRRGQRIRISATGRVNLGAGRVSTPAGVPAISDNEKLMRSYPTGALIAVIGDDNDDFIFVGGKREFIAQRDGVLFLGVNEGNLSDNTGTYDVVIEAEAMSGTR